ncbi:MAG: hypothetical protein ACXVCE_08305, partial [Bacteriovorax sp.]
QMKGRVYKTRYHFRRLKTPREIQNVLNYILGIAQRDSFFSQTLSDKKFMLITSAFEDLRKKVRLNL